MEVGRRDLEGLAADASLRDAAERTLRARLGAVMDRLPAAAAGGDDGPGHAHKLRVATRRSAAALDLFERCVRKKDHRRWRRALRRIRRAAGQVRDMDVLTTLLLRVQKKASPDTHAAIDFLLHEARERRREGEKRLIRAAERHPRSRLREMRRTMLRNLREREGDGASERLLFRDAGRATLREILADFRAAGEADLSSIEALHGLRLAGKRLRYATEVFGPLLGEQSAGSLLPMLEELQESLGAINDSDQMVAFLRSVLGESEPDADSDEAKAPVRDGKAGTEKGAEKDCEQHDLRPDLRGPIDALARRWLRQREDRAGAFLETWGPDRARAVEEAFERAMASAPGEAPLRAPDPRAAQWDSSRNGAPTRPEIVGDGAPSALIAAAPEPHAAPKPWRLAAIDVGTNSIRLIVAEAYAEGNYRVLDDEREIARLGKGLATTGALAPDAVERALLVIDHMRKIAEGYGAERIRVVGTAAVREASNGEEFRRLLRERTGLSLEIIDAPQEAKLAYISAAHAFDLRSLPAAVVDIGGGSTEIVLSSGPVIEQVYTVPLGAVRLTERFGGPDESCGARWEDMRRHVRKAVRDHVPDLPFTPQLLVGSGGTFEAVAKVAMQERGARGASATVRGYDMTRAEVKRLLERLRAMPLRERLRVPGLSEQRAEIIVAGACVLHRVMKRLGVERMRVNDGGIRDGMLLAMIGEFFAGPDADAPLTPQPGREPRSRAQIRSVRHFAASCNYERRHCYHVASLALQLYDQATRDPALSAAADASCGAQWREADARLLLEAAGVLHDCGYHINYARHHLHSYHLIMHSDMAGFTRREIEIVANVARYHRGPEPKGKHENLAELARADRDLVKALSAILRVADGLDRTHMQNVRAIRVSRAEADPRRPAPVRLGIAAPADPAVDIWGSQRKSDLFREVFHADLEYAWVGAEDGATAATGGDQAGASGATGATGASPGAPTESSRARS